MPNWSRSQVTLRTVLTVSAGVVASGAVVYFLVHTSVSLTLALGSVMAAVAMDHVVEALGRLGLGRRWATTVEMAGVTILLIGLGILLVPPILMQARALLAALPALLRTLERTPWFERIDAGFHLEDQVRGYGSAAVGGMPPLLTAIGGVASALAGILAFLVLSIFMLVFGRDLATTILVELEPAGRERYDRMAAKIYRSIGGYLGGLVGICTANALLTTTALFLLRVPFFLTLGILSGISSLVPFAGPLLTGTAITLIAYVTGDGWTALAVGCYFAIYGLLEGNVLAPFVYRRTAHVNPLVNLLAVLFLVEFMGLAGAVLAVPLAAAAQIIIAEVVRFQHEQVGLHGKEG